MSECSKVMTLLNLFVKCEYFELVHHKGNVGISRETQACRYDVAEKEKYQLIGECCLRKANVRLSGGNRGVGNMLGDSTWRNEMSKGVVIRN